MTGIAPDTVAAAGERFGDALVELDRWLDGVDRLCGDAPSLCEALMVAVYVRMDGLRRLGPTGAGRSEYAPSVRMRAFSSAR